MGKWVVLVIAILLGIYFRFWNFSDRINFGPEQAMSLLFSADYLNKPSLIGQPYFRWDSSGHQLFAGPYFSYSLLLLQKIFAFNPLPITASFALLNLATGMITAWLCYRLTKNLRVTVIYCLLFSLNSLMISHSLYIWIVNWFPLIGSLNFYFLYRFWKSGRWRFAFLAGLFSGLGICFDYTYLFASLALFLLLVIKKPSSVIPFLLGNILVGLPLIAFDLRHGFYLSRTLWQYLLDTIASPGQSHLAYFHFLHLLPLILFIISLALNRFRRFAPVIIILYLFSEFLNLNSGQISMSSAAGMPAGLTYPTQLAIVSDITAQNPQNFNVAAMFDFDTRAHPYRYLLQYLYHIKPLGILEYPQSSSLFVIAPADYSLDSSSAWELTSYPPHTTQLLSRFPPDILLYRKDVAK